MPSRSSKSPSSSPKAPVTSSHYNVAKLLLIGLAFHLVYINSVFDCYFTSPVVHGMKSYGYLPEGDAPAKRLVLIVGDGLRADLLFSLNAFPDIPGSPEVVAPHLRSIAETRGAFGISHTRVPTESRPGHVAIIGGMYEDVSAVTKGWKTNPVDFDSIFNQSTSTYSFGSPDILPMFAKGATPPDKVKTFMYDEDEEDFTKDATALDVWVLDHLRELFRNAMTDPGLAEDLRSDKVVFFLHLLGLDTTGHSYRPHSKEYMQNIQVVDTIVRETENLISEFYGEDNKTAFVFTADHGMSVIGNHGDGHPDNTRTPLITWGAGIRSPLPDSSTQSTHDAYSAPWGPTLTRLYRRDVEQADLAALMAALLGVNWPVNSVGVLPDVDVSKEGYLDFGRGKEGEEGVAQAGLVNAKVILEQYRVKDELKRKHTLFYKPYKALSPSSQATTSFFSTDTHPEILHITHLIAQNQYTPARHAAAELIRTSLAGLHYLQTYDRFLIRGFVTFAYLGWGAYASLYLFRPLDNAPRAGELKLLGTSRLVWGIRAASWVALVGFWGFFAMQRSPWTFWVYILFPCYFWGEVGVQVALALQTKLRSGGELKKVKQVIRIVGAAVGVVCALLGMVVGYTHRSIWSIGFILIGVLWPLSWFWSRNDDLRSRASRPWTVVAWVMLCLVNAVFPLLSVDKTESLPTIMLGGLAILLAGLATASRVLKDVKNPAGRRTLMKLFTLQVTFILVTMLITASSVRHLQAKRGLPWLNQLAGWAVLVISSLLPFAYTPKAHTKYIKLLTYFLGFGPCFVILSISVEGLFFVAYSGVLAAWVGVEQIVRTKTRSGGTPSAARLLSTSTSTPATSGASSSGLSRRGASSGSPINHGGQRSTDLNSAAKKSPKSELEHALAHKFELDDLRIALFFLFFVQVGFFGTGNVASISSFYLAPVYRLIPIFNPFYMSSLLIFKIIAPYVMLSVTFAVLNDALGLPPFSLLLVALTITDGMTLTFFYNVRDTGSWLEIGQSISFFCITSLLMLWAAGICAAGEWLMGGVLSSSRAEKLEKVD